MSTNPLSAGARERWAELGGNDPERIEERWRGNPWRLFLAGWVESTARRVVHGQLLSVDDVRADCLQNRALIQWLVNAGDVMRQWLGLTIQMDGESCPDCGYDWGKGHNHGCAQLEHRKAIQEWDAAAAGFKSSDQ